MGTRSTQLRVGIALVGFYVVAAVVTTGWSPGGMRPLFDGFGSHPGQYNWVNPPREFAEGNQEPESATAGVILEADGNAPASVSTDDGQVLAALPPKSVAPHPPDTAATLNVSPVDAATLGPLPDGLRAEGNSYRVRVVYKPSNTPARLEEPGSVGLTAAARADILLFSADGRRWERGQAVPLNQGNGVTGLLEQTGYYLAAAEGEPRPVSAGSGKGAPLVVYLGLGLVPLVLAWLLFSKRGRPAPARPSAQGKRRPPPSSRKPGRKR